jgi:hypothetical protein
MDVTAPFLPLAVVASPPSPSPTIKKSPTNNKTHRKLARIHWSLCSALWHCTDHSKRVKVQVGRFD